MRTTFASISGMPYGKTKEEHTSYSRWYRNLDRKKYNKIRLEWSNKHRERRTIQARRSYLFKKYGITIEKFDNILLKQNNRCLICGCKFKKVIDSKKRVKYSLHIDHNHKTGKIRGILCHNCNVAIGHFRDNIKLLNKAIKYLDDRSENWTK